MPTTVNAGQWKSLQYSDEMCYTDSVPTSYGVTDDGVGVAVGLELVRYFVHHPPSKTLIFLFNNFEEGGLIGAKAFVKHPWYKSVRLVINLGTGYATAWQVTVK